MRLLFYMNIQNIQKEQWQDVCAIFIQGIETKNATFSTMEELPTWEQWDSKYHKHSRLFAQEEGGKVQGWAALLPYSTKYAYRGIAEVSIYFDLAARGKGYGAELLQRLIEASESNGIWSLHARIFPENKASIAIHQKLGFRTVGTLQKAGQIDGVWRDVILLERRSTKVGM